MEHPGVYITEVSSGVRPIEGVSTSTTAFIGKAEKGYLDRAFMVTSFIEFQKNYGGFLRDAYLAHSALQYFNNGGKRLYIVRVAANDVVADASISDRQTGPVKCMTIAASSAGKWGNELNVIVENGSIDPGDDFKVSIQNNGATVEVHDNLSMNPDALNFAPNIVNANSSLVRIVVDGADDSTTSGTSVSGATPAVSLPDSRRRLRVNINGDGFQEILLEKPVGTANEIRDALTKAMAALTPLRASTPTEALSKASASFANGLYTLTSGVKGKLSSVQVANSSAENAATLLKLGIANGGSETTGSAVLRPATGTYNLGKGDDGTTPQEADYTAGFALLDNVRDVNIVAVPGIGSKPVIEFGANYCSLRQDCFFVGDMLASIDTKELAKSFMDSLSVKNSYGAVYFPWLKAIDPTGVSAELLSLPPSGYVTGLYARTDARRGVWKAPAGTEANLGGAVGLKKETTDTEQDTLNPIGVNVIRFFPASGIVVWGARTLATQKDPEYRYIPIRRLAIFLEQSIYNGIQWAVFEPNDEDLWSSLRMNISSFMMTMFRAGAFQGDTASKAFFVKCDGQTNPQDQINAGIVTVMVGFAPLRPAEFVVIQISQKTAEAAG